MQCMPMAKATDFTDMGSNLLEDETLVKRYDSLLSTPLDADFVATVIIDLCTRYAGVRS